MKRITATVISLLVFTLTSVPALGWGEKGHKTIGQIAEMRLANTNTLVRIKQILKPNETLAGVSNWADYVKDENKFRVDATHWDADTQHFYRKLANKHNREWHFVDLPLNCQAYDDPVCQPFTSSADIVHMINLAIKKLKGGTVARLTKRNALRLLVHLMGDLHQPLHVGVGFINVDDDQILIVRNPNQVLAADFPHDRGANRLLISGENADNLHSFWDSDLVSAASANQSVTQFANSLNSSIPASNGWDGQGNSSGWIAQWASDSLRVSNSNAYDATVQLTEVVVINDDTKYRTQIGPNYHTQNTAIAKQQLQKGGYRLAKLLQAILP